MKNLTSLTLLILLFTFSFPALAVRPKEQTKEVYPISKLSIEPAIGLRPAPVSDLTFSNLVQLNLSRRISIISHSGYTYNNAFLRNFNYIKTNYNYSLSQKAGIGASLYSEHTSSTFSLLAGVKYEAYSESMVNPEFEELTASESSFSPDFGLMYNLKIGKKKYFFSYRMYIPIYPFPLKSTDIFSIDSNIANISLEFGIGIRLI